MQMATVNNTDWKNAKHGPEMSQTGSDSVLKIYLSDTVIMNVKFWRKIKIK